MILLIMHYLQRVKNNLFKLRYLLTLFACLRQRQASQKIVLGRIFFGCSFFFAPACGRQAMAQKRMNIR
jgi:hypothetical protein